MKALIPDCSFWQDKIDFEQMHLAGADGVILRGGQRTWKDTRFDQFRKDARTVLPFGSYFYYDGTFPPKQQAQLYADILGNDAGQLGAWLDLEDGRSGLGYNQWSHWYDFIAEFQRLQPNVEMGIYTRASYVNGRIPSDRLSYFGKLPLWVANYGVLSPAIPNGWMDWLFWQWTDKGNGKMFGVGSLDIDLNYFNGDLAQFNQRFGLDGTTPEPPPTTGDNMYDVTITWDNGASVRYNPNTGGSPIAVLPKGTKFQASAIVADSSFPNNALRLWAKISGGQYDGRYVAVVYDQPRATYTLVNPPTDPPPVEPPPPTEPSTTYTAVFKDNTTGETWSGVLEKE